MNRELFLDAVKSKQTPCNIFGTPTSIVCRDLMKETSVYFPHAHTDPQKMFALALAGHTILGLDVVMPLFSVCHEAAAMGCSVNWGTETMMPQAGKPIFEEPEDIVIPDNLLTTPACQVPIKAISLLKTELADSAAVCGKVFGPWTQAYHYFGLENFLIMTVEDPAKTRKILDKLLPVTIAFANAQIDAGADCILIADHATSDLCSPAAYEQFLIGLHSRLAAELSVPTILHICGNTADRIKFIAQTGIDSFHWDTKTGSSEKVRRLAGDKLSLIGGISNYTLLRDTPDDIISEAQAALRAGINIIGPECAIPLTTPLQNLKAVTQIDRHSIS